VRSTPLSLSVAHPGRSKASFESTRPRRTSMNLRRMFRLAYHARFREDRYKPWSVWRDGEAALLLGSALAERGYRYALLPTIAGRASLRRRPRDGPGGRERSRPLAVHAPSPGAGLVRRRLRESSRLSRRSSP